jgi:hypothetical protein
VSICFNSWQKDKKAIKNKNTVMPKVLITLVFRQLIDAATEGIFAKNVLHYSYGEFKTKSQVYNPGGKFNTFIEMNAIPGKKILIIPIPCE